MNAIVDGLIAGYGIAIPVGAIAILIVSRAMEDGLRPGLMAAAGVATCDLLFAAMAVFAGQEVVSAVSPYSFWLKLLSGTVLIAMGAFGLLSLRKDLEMKEDGHRGDGDLTTYLKFIGIAILNPFTVVYFLALIMGSEWNYATFDSVLFIAGVAIASITWQGMLAWLGAAAKRIASPKFMKATIVVGNMIVILLGIQVMFF